MKIKELKPGKWFSLQSDLGLGYNALPKSSIGLVINGNRFIDPSGTEFIPAIFKTRLKWVPSDTEVSDSESQFDNMIGNTMELTKSAYCGMRVGDTFRFNGEIYMCIYDQYNRIMAVNLYNTTIYEIDPFTEVYYTGKIIM